MRGPMMRKVFGQDGKGYGDKDSYFFITNDLAAIVWSPCGVSTNFRINTSIMAQKRPGATYDTFIGIDTVDAVVKDAYTIRYHLMSRGCSN